MTPEAKAQKQELTVETILQELGTRYRVDTHSGAMQWWFRAKDSDRFTPVALWHVWRQAFRALGRTEINAPAFMVSAAMKTVQERTPILTFDEWADRTNGVPANWLDSQLSNHPHWRAA